jgi:hypothetical protein
VQHETDQLRAAACVEASGGLLFVHGRRLGGSGVRGLEAITAQGKW